MPIAVAIICLNIEFLIKRKEKLKGIDKIIQNATLTYSRKLIT